MSMNRKARRAAKATAVTLPTGSPQTPRAAKDIQEEYAKVCAQLGEVTYQEQVFKSQGENLKQKIHTLNTEMGQRMELDRAASNVPSIPGKV